MKTRILAIFRNQSEGRLRAGWRIVLTWAAFLAVFLPIQAILKPLIPASWSRDQAIDLLLLIVAFIATIIILISRVWIDKRSVGSLGVKAQKGFLRDILAGFAISAILVLIVLSIEVGFGWVRFEIVQAEWPTQLTRILYLFILTGLVVSWWENLFFVSYLFLNFRDGCGFWCAFILNCLIFSFIHMGNPNASIWAFGGIFLIHSYEIFGFLRTKNLWLILGVHAGWNFFQGLAGFPVSGNTANRVVTQVNTTPTWLGGGEFGPEAGLVMVITGTAAYLMIWFYTKSRIKPA